MGRRPSHAHGSAERPPAAERGSAPVPNRGVRSGEPWGGLTMPVPEEFIKKRTEVTISKASLKALSCQRCGARMEASNIRGGYAKCEYCGHIYTLEVEGQPGA